MWEESEEKAQEIFLNKPATRKTLAEDHFLQQKMHNLEIMICNADCSHSYAERKKILQMKGMKLYYCGINGKDQGDINSACKRQQTLSMLKSIPLLF